jgi:hypothetical protein
MPLTIGPQNCADVLGVNWRWARTKARELGVPIWTVDGKSVIPASQMLAALERAGMLHEPEAPPAPEPGSADELAEMRAKLGMRRVGGSR